MATRRGERGIIYTIQSITSRHEHKKGSFRLEGARKTKQKMEKDGVKQGGTKNAKQTDVAPSKREQRGGFHIPEHGGIEIREQARAQWSGNASSGGRTHPPIQPSQLLRKLLKSFVVAPDGSVSREGGGRYVPRVVSLKQVSQ